MNLSVFFNHDFKDGDFELYDADGNVVYWEYKDEEHFWSKLKRDSDGRVIHKYTSDGFWAKTEYDLSGNEISYKCSDDIYKVKE